MQHSDCSQPICWFKFFEVVGYEVPYSPAGVPHRDLIALRAAASHSLTVSICHLASRRRVLSSIMAAFVANGE